LLWFSADLSFKLKIGGTPLKNNTRIIIVGAGFAGASASKKIFNGLPFDSDVKITVIDKNDYVTMLPSLPDIAGGRVDEEVATAKIKNVIPKGIDFIQSEVKSIDLIRKKVITSNDEFKYDFLVIAPGSVTNFYDKDDKFKSNYKLDSLEDAKKIRTDFSNYIKNRDELNVVISGAGFTGLELACNLFHLSSKTNKKTNFYMVERSSRIMNFLSEKRSDFIKKSMDKIGINVILNDEVNQVIDGTVIFKKHEKIEDAFFAWCSGVKMGLSITGNQKMTSDCRIIVDDNLRISEHKEVFVAGDAAYFTVNKVPIRRSVNFSAMQGSLVGKNILALIKNEKMKKFKAIDLGWVIPLYITSIGEAFGYPTKGRLGIMLHYAMCGIKNYSIKNFIRYILFAFQFVGTKVKKKGN